MEEEGSLKPEERRDLLTLANIFSRGSALVASGTTTTPLASSREVANSLANP